MSWPPTPTNGDIVVRQELRNDAFVFVLHVMPGPDQIAFHARDAAVAQAVMFAKRLHVSAWMTNGDRTVTLLEDFRRN